VLPAREKLSFRFGPYYILPLSIEPGSSLFFRRHCLRNRFFPPCRGACTCYSFNQNFPLSRPLSSFSSKVVLCSAPAEEEDSNLFGASSGRSFSSTSPSKEDIGDLIGGIFLPLWGVFFSWRHSMSGAFKGNLRQFSFPGRSSSPPLCRCAFFSPWTSLPPSSP